MKRITGLTIILLAFLSCKKKEIKINPTKENITESVYASGIIKSINQYQVYAPVNGLIKNIFVKEGDKVKKDETIVQIMGEIAKLNTASAEIAANNNTISNNADKLNELKSNINFLKSKMENDLSLAERQQNLWNEGIGSRNELDQKRLSYKNALASYNAALFRYNDLQRQLKFSAAQSNNNVQISKTIANDFLVKSQVNGMVYSILKKNGEMVNTLNPIAIIGGASNFIIELQVDEYDIGKIKPNQKVIITMDSYKDKVYEAVITRIIPIMNERTRSFTVEAIFVIQPNVLYPNLTAEANIVIQSKKNILTIPREFLINDSLVLMSDKSKRKITVGLKDYQKAEVINGLITTDVIMKPTP